MLTSDDRILTTHTGSLPRSEELAELMVAREGGKLDADQAARLPGLTHEATVSVLQGQADAGIDVAQ